MARKSFCTREMIWAEADQIEAEGGVAAVRSRLGGGSFTTITAAMNARKPLAEPPGNPSMRDEGDAAPGLAQVLPAHFSGRLEGVAQEIWGAARAEAHACHCARIAQLEAELRAALAKIEALRAALQT